MWEGGLQAARFLLSLMYGMLLVSEMFVSRCEQLVPHRRR